MKKMAVVKDGIVINLALWDGLEPWAPEGCDLVDTEGKHCDIGFYLVDGEFYAPESLPVQSFLSEMGLVESSLIAENVSVWQRFKEWLKSFFA
jgi:hypothetical protein